MVFGSDISGLIYFDDMTFAKQLADLALIFILFTGGFGTKKAILKTVLKPSLLLATLGVILTAAISALLLKFTIGFELSHALLLGCIISSTDAAAVFAILRSRSLKPQISSISEIESATNDPMAIVLTITMVQLISLKMQQPLSIGLMVAWQFVAGIGIGFIIGKLGCFFLDRIKIIDKGYFFICIIAIILLSYSAADMLHASGMLASFFAGYIIGNTAIPYKKTLSTFLDALGTISNVCVFVLLGLLVFPKQFGRVWVTGLFLFVIITFIARPVSVAICTISSKFSIKEKAFLSWSGLRGAVPIILATYPVAAGLERSQDIFNIVFFAVVLSMLIQGTTIGKVADLFNLSTKARKKPAQIMELTKLYASDLELSELVINEDDFEGEAAIFSLDLPEGTTITMINRNDSIIAPRGSTKIYPGDVLYILSKSANLEKIESEIYHHFTTKNGNGNSKQS